MKNKLLIAALFIVGTMQLQAFEPDLKTTLEEIDGNKYSNFTSQYNWSKETGQPHEK